MMKILFFLIISVTFVFAWRPYKVTITDLKYDYDKELSKVNMTLKESSDMSLLNVLFIPNQKLNSLFATIKVVMYPDGELNTTIVNFNKTINYCKFLSNPNLEPVFRNYYEIIERFGSIPKRCPFKAKELIFIYNLYPDEEKLPRSWQQGKLNLYLEFYTDSRDNPKIFLFYADIWANIDFSKAMEAFQAFGNM